MRKEKIALSFAAALVGLIVAIGAFFFYQSTKKINPSEIKKLTLGEVTPTPKASIFLTVNEPKDEAVFSTRTVKVTGITSPDAKILIYTQANEEAAVPAGNGNFSADITIEVGENILEIVAVAPNGETIKTTRTVTFSTETF